MSARIAIIGCGASKLSESAPARDLYTGNLFRAARDHVEARGLPWLILSALHGLISPDLVIAPYDVTMAETKAEGQRINHWPWCGQGFLCGVRGRLLSEVWQYAHGPGRWARGTPVAIEVHAGALYLEAIQHAAAVYPDALTVEAPLRGRQIGERLHHYAVTRRVQVPLFAWGAA